ncbi:MAG: outer membrane beta-barrel protein [Nitrospira sp.]|nr:outer membrane beta-barrel protein [Nitrospira sp.]
MIAAVLLCEALPALSVHGETLIVPTAIVRSRYDSNIYRQPVQLLAPGTQPQDFITTVGGGLDLLHKTRDIEADVRMGGTFNALVVNSNRNYFAALLSANIGLDRWVDQYVRGARLNVAENLRYSPTLPSFLAGARDVPEDVSLISGTQGFRANTLFNTTNVTGSYPLSRDVSLEGGYLFGLRSVGRLQGTESGLADLVYFNTMNNTWHGGPRYRLTRNDSVAVFYKQMFLSQERPGGSRTINTNVINFAAEYDKAYQEWGFKIQGGVTVVEPGGQVFPTGTLQVTTTPERDTAVRLALSREARPSFFQQSGAMISNIARLGVSHRIYERLTLDGTIAYAYNQYLPISSHQIYQNFTTTSRLAYKLTRNFTGEIFGLYQYIDSNRSAVEYQFPRVEVGFMLTMEWR